MFRIVWMILFLGGSLALGSLSVSAQSYKALNDSIDRLSNEGKYAAAIPYALKAIDSAKRQFGDTAGRYADQLSSLADLYYNMGNYPSAVTYYTQVLPIRKKTSGEGSLDYATALNSAALTNMQVGNFAAAEPLLQTSLTIRKTILGIESQDYIDCLGNLAGCYLFSGNFDKAEPLLKEVSRLRKKISGETSMSYATSLNGLGVLYFYKGDYASAEPLYLQFASIIKKTAGEESLEYATSQNNLGDLYNSMGNYSAAEICHKTALAIRKAAEGTDHPDYGQSLTQLGLTYFNMGKYAAAEPLFKEGLAIRQRTVGEGSPDYSTSLNNLATLYFRMGQYLLAEPLYKKAIAIRKKQLGERHTDYAVSLGNLAVMYYEMGNFTESEPLIKISVEIYRNAVGEKSPVYANALDGLAEFYKRTGHFSDAERVFRQSLEIKKTAFGEKNIQYAHSLNSLGNLYDEEGNYAAAEPLLKEANTISLQVLGENNPEYAIGLNNLAEVYRSTGRFRAADSLYRRSLVIREKTIGKQNSQYAHDLTALALLSSQMGDHVAGERFIAEGTNTLLDYMRSNFLNLSELEKMKWLDNETSNLELVPSLLQTYPHPSAAFLREVCTQQFQLKGFVLNDGTAILQRARNSADPQVKEMLDAWQSNKATLAKQYGLPINRRIRALDSLERLTNDQEKQLNLRSSEFRNSQQDQQIDFTRVQRRLKKGEAAIEFIRYHYRQQLHHDPVMYAAFVILPEDTVPHFVPLCGEGPLAVLMDRKNRSSGPFIRQFYRGIKPDNGAGYLYKGDSLYNMVWKPLMPWLKGIKKISIAPAGLLCRIAFNALPAGNKTLLIDRYQLRTYSSVRQLAESPTTQQAPLSATASPSPSSATTMGALLYGDIQFGRMDASAQSAGDSGTNGRPSGSAHPALWDSLPGTALEVRRIQKLFEQHGLPVRVVSGAAATEESIKQLSGVSPTILHLATHGFSLPDHSQDQHSDPGDNNNSFSMAENPLMRSGVILAGANSVWNGAAPVAGKEDGILTAYEIAGLDLGHTDLVVLSACETALGDIKGTEGVFGLQRAFKLAGVKNMLLSLWQIPDEQTVELMDAFYTNKLTGSSNYDAFYEAQLSMRKKYPPYYWAAFVLSE